MDATTKPRPVRALCDQHRTRPDWDCRRCRTAGEVTGWWRHEQGRCTPLLCPHCEHEAGGHENLLEAVEAGTWRRRGEAA